jgi:serine/threonine-protein kinase
MSHHILAVSCFVFSVFAGAALAERPRDWFGGGKDYELTTDTEVKHGGKSSGVVRSTADPPEAFGTLTQGCQAVKYRGKRVRLSGWVKSERVEGWSGLWMRIDSKDKGGLAFDNMNNRAIKGTSDWAQFNTVLDVPDTAEQFFYGCLLAGKGKVWVDDMKLEEVGADVAVTDLKIGASDRGDNPLPDVPAEPANLEFEP